MDNTFANPAAPRALIIALSGLALVPVSIWTLMIGTSDIGLLEIGKAIVSHDGSHDHTVITAVRLPRLLTGLLVGAALAVAGAIMQAVTGNPLASPGLLGVNSGAALAVVLAIVFLGVPAKSLFIWFAFAGAGVSAVIVYLVASAGPGGLTPVKLVLSGAMFATFTAALTASVLIFDANTFGAVRLWTAGTLSGAEMSNLVSIAPYGLVGLVLAIAISRQMMTLSLGPDVSRTIGQNVILWQLIAGLCVIVLAGSSVALAGPVSFVGLVVPHIARMLVGVDYRWIIPFCAFGGALLVVTADSFLRQLITGQNVPVGVAMALLGTPLFIHLARNRLGGRTA